MATPRRLHYLTLADTLALHRVIMVRTGSAPAPLRDEGLLESALNRARTAAYYVDADLVRQAALLAVGISQAQAFVEGNKRTAFVVADLFLRLNGFMYGGDPVEFGRRLEAVAEAIADRATAADDVERWLREHTVPRSSR